MVLYNTDKSNFSYTESIGYQVLLGGAFSSYYTYICNRMKRLLCHDEYFERQCVVALLLKIVIYFISIFYKQFLNLE